jgi:hypothetical protein
MLATCSLGSTGPAGWYPRGDGRERAVASTHAGAGGSSTPDCFWDRRGIAITSRPRGVSYGVVRRRAPGVGVAAKPLSPDDAPRLPRRRRQRLDFSATLFGEPGWRTPAAPRPQDVSPAGHRRRRRAAARMPREAMWSLAVRVDALLGYPFSCVFWGVTAMVLGLVGGAIPIARRRRAQPLQSAAERSCRARY